MLSNFGPSQGSVPIFNLGFGLGPSAAILGAFRGRFADMLWS